MTLASVQGDKQKLRKTINKKEFYRIYQGYTFFRIHKDIHSTGFTRIYILKDSQGYTFYRIHKNIHSTGFTRIYILQDSLGYWHWHEYRVTNVDIGLTTGWQILTLAWVQGDKCWHWLEYRVTNVDIGMSTG